MMTESSCILCMLLTYDMSIDSKIKQNNNKEDCFHREMVKKRCPEKAEHLTFDKVTNKPKQPRSKASVNWVLTRSDTNRPVQSQKQARNLKFWIEEEQGLYYLCSENKGTDQLCTSCKAG